MRIVVEGRFISAAGMREGMRNGCMVFQFDRIGVRLSRLSVIGGYSRASIGVYQTRFSLFFHQPFIFSLHGTLKAKPGGP
jgi:hypothetical protein